MVDSQPASKPAAQAAAASFAPTRWTVVLSAREKEAPKAKAALQELCQTYWYPLYVFARRQGHNHEDSEDLVQGFFARLLEKRELEQVNRSKGKFRSFLMAGLKNYAANEWDKAHRQKRGGRHTPLSLDFTEGEAAYALVVADPMTPEKQFERAWALEILAIALEKIQAECAANGKERQFEALKELLAYKTTLIPYAERASQAGLTEGSVRVVVSKIRGRYGELIKQEVAQTMVNPTEAEIKEELRHLLAAL